MGNDFSGVRIHTDSRAAEAAQSVNARAFTLGNDVVFNRGEYAPQSDSGKRLLAHELTHVIQQGRAKNLLSQRSPVLMRQAGHEINCYEKYAISGLSDKKLIDEITKIKSGRKKWWLCRNQGGRTTKSYLKDLVLEATMRSHGLLTHPTGIANTRVGKRLSYGAAFTHTLSISAHALSKFPHGKISHLKGSQITEKIFVARDDFRLGVTPKQAIWTLGRMPGSPAADKFTDFNLTGQFGVGQACAHKRFKRLPPVREEIQAFYWRKFPGGWWEPNPFYTNRMIFKIVFDRCGGRRKRYCAVTINNGVVYKQPYYGAPPRM